MCAGGTEPDELEVVEVFGPWRDVDADRFAEVLAPFEDESGIEIRYVGSVDFVSDLLGRTGEGNNPPDVAMVPQPALVRQLAADGHIFPLEANLEATVVESYGADGAALGAIDGTQYAVPYRTTIKSLVWYRPDVFTDRGWVVPATLGELTTLVDRIEADSDIAPGAWASTPAPPPAGRQPTGPKTSCSVPSDSTATSNGPQVGSSSPTRPSPTRSPSSAH